MLDRSIDLSSLRTQFPALQQLDETGQPYIFFDGPGGTQVPQAVIDAMTEYFKAANAINRLSYALEVAMVYFKK